jgi:hypothetical protein
MVGKNFPKSKSNIKNILIIPKIPKAIGDNIPITFVSDVCKKVVNMSPSKVMKTIIPKVTKSPIISGEDFFLVLFERKDMKAGNKGNTQTAVSGVNTPKIKEEKISEKNIFF